MMNTKSGHVTFQGRHARIKLLAIFVLAIGRVPAHADDNAAFMRFPTLHGDSVVFVAHGNLWRVARSGGSAVRLTSEPGSELMPRYSPDGQWIAFTGSYQGNRDVYVIPATGGRARRLTFHSDIVDDAPIRWGPDNMVVTWTPDSRAIVYLSRREAWNGWYGLLFKVPVAGGASEALPLDRGGFMSFSPDGHRIVYNRIFRNFRTWKRYDGGLAQDIHLYDFDSKALTRLTDWPGTETAPMWYQDTVYFLSDHDANRRGNLWALNLNTHEFRQLTHFTDYDIDFPSLGDTGITFQQGGNLYVMDLPSETLHKLAVQVPDDGLHTSPRFVEAKKWIRDLDAAQVIDYSLAPNGKRVLYTARGDLFSVPAEHGATRNLTNSSGADEDHPAWSPDGTMVAYTTDASGNHQIALRPAQGGDERLLTHFASGFLYQPVWAPGGDRLAFSDNEQRLWYVSTAGGEPKQVAHDAYVEMHDYTWSPDGKWLAYSVTDQNQVRALWLYNLDSGKASRISAARDNDFGPAFDPDGKTLYFLSTRHEFPIQSDAEFDMAAVKSTGVYALPLAADGASPLAPRSDEGAAEAGKNEAQEKSDWKAGAIAPMRIDLDGLMSRAVPLPMLGAASIVPRKGRVYYSTQPLHPIEGKIPGQTSSLHAFEWKERKDTTVIDDLDSYQLSADGTKVLYKKDQDWFVVDSKPEADGKDKAAKKPLDLAQMRAYVDPRQEWSEMFESAWRLERDLNFSRKMNGVDWNAVHAAYRPLLPLVGSRDDLNYLIGEMQGELGNSHTYVGAGDQDDPTIRTSTALLGVDFRLDTASGRYFLARIYPGDNSRETYRSPLRQPGLNVKEGDFLIAVDGQELSAPTDPYSPFAGKAGQLIRLTIADTPSGVRRDVTVEPLKQELDLREHAWIEGNRARVDKLSGGAVAYLYMSDMSERGMEQFFSQFYNQLDKRALLVDVRWNGGGFIDQIILERLRRVLVGMTTIRSGTATTEPPQLINGPKVCLINHYSASDGDIFPFYFRKYGLGPLIGTRTWGGVRGIRGYWPLLDGGYVTIPEDSLYGLDSQWVIENQGVSPDFEVEDSPGELLSGKDTQLEAGVSYLLKALKKNPGGLPPPPPALPAYPPAGHD